MIQVSQKRVGGASGQRHGRTLQGRALRQKSSRGETSACTPRELWSVSYTSELSQTEAKEMGLPVSPTAYPWSGYKLQSLPVPCTIRQSGLVALEHPPWWLWEPRAHDLEMCTEITSKRMWAEHQHCQPHIRSSPETFVSFTANLCCRLHI